MTVPVPTPRATAPSGSPQQLELLSVALACVAFGVAGLVGAGPRFLALVGPIALSPASTLDAVWLTLAQFLPAIVAAVVLAIPFALGKTPRIHRRLLEPSLIAAWVAVFCGAAAAYLIGRSPIAASEWLFATNDQAVVFARLAEQQQAIALGVWFVCAALIVPLLHELVFRFLLIEWLAARRTESRAAVGVTRAATPSTGQGVTPWLAVALSGTASGIVYALHGSGPLTAALVRGIIAALLGACLALVVLRARKARGLGLTVLGHGAFVAMQLLLALRSA